MDGTTTPQTPSSLCDHACRLLGSSLRSLSLFGSQLWAGELHGTRGDADLFAILDDGALAGAAARLGKQPHPLLLQHLPPLTLALSIPGSERARAKLNLIEISALRQALHALPDVYLAGRLSKPMRLYAARDAACQAEHSSLVAEAAQAISTVVLQGQRGHRTRLSVVSECAFVSYRAELRPEGPRRLQALWQRNQDALVARFDPLLVATAPTLGLRYDPGEQIFFDERDRASRARQQLAYARLIRHSRLRSLARWPKQMLVYRGWVGYVAGKLRRSHRAEREGSPA